MRYTKDHSQTISERWALWWRNDQKGRNKKHWQGQEGRRITVEVVNDLMNSQNYDTRITTQIEQLTILKYSIRNELFIQQNAYNDWHRWWQREKHEMTLKRSYDQFTTIEMGSIFEFRQHESTIEREATNDTKMSVKGGIVRFSKTMRDTGRSRRERTSKIESDKTKEDSSSETTISRRRSNARKTKFWWSTIS